MNIITYETNYKEFNSSLLKYTCSKYDDIRLTVLGIGDKFKGVYQKILAFSKYVRNLDPNDIVMCCDSRDVFVWASGSEILNKFINISDGILFGDDPLCFPMLPLYQFYPQDTYLCSGVYIGYVDKLNQMFEIAINYHDNLLNVMVENFGITEQEINDEEYIYENRLGNSIRQSDQFMCSLVFLTTSLINLDYNNELIQTFYQCPSSLPQYTRIKQINKNVRSGRDFDLVFDRKTMKIYNEHMDTYPLVFHAAGPPHSISMLNKYIRDDYGKIATLF